jgi:ATP-dependent Lon protease
MAVSPLTVSRQVSVDAVNRALGGDRMVLFLLQKNANDEPTPDDLHRIGTVAVIRQMAAGPSGLRLLVEGVARVQAEFMTRDGNLLKALVRPRPEPAVKTVEVEAHVRHVQELVERALSVATGLSPDMRQLVSAIDDPLRLAYVLASLLDLKAEDKQALLEEDALAVKLTAIAQALQREIEVLELKGKIESQAQQEMTDAQRQYMLRQQLKAIQQELGEGETEIQQLRERLTKAALPPSVHETVSREIDRLERMTSSSPEYQMVRTYLDWIFELPWSVSTEDRLDPVEARRVLDADHYGLDKVKARIVEYLAVRKLKGDMKGPILCFVGPPGVGKTSLGQSIARAMNRKFVRLSLGGVRDEAEIRGHRRTYIGALPGRIVQAMKQAGAINPVFMLDELDKLTAGGFSGDPAAALLEVLDPAQNNTFRDHYLRPARAARPAAIQARHRVPAVAPGRGHGPRLDRSRRRRVVRGSRADAVGHRPAHAHRPARQRDAGVRARRPQPHPSAGRRARRRSGLPLGARPARARAGRVNPEGRPLGGRHDGHRDRLGPAPSTGRAERGDDRRDHPLRSCPARRRDSREGAGRQPSGPRHRDPARAEHG